MSDKILFKPSALIGAAVLTAIFWIASTIVDVYAYAALGAIYELASIPMLVLGIGVTLASAWLCFRSKGPNRLWPLLSLGICVATILIVLLNKP